MEKRIFLSYNWNDTKDVNRLDNLFSRFQIHLTRDIRDLKYNANIHNFMNGIRKHDKLILYVSDSYLRSVNCMYEASQVLEMQGKVLIILKNGTLVFSINDKKELIDYWKKKYQEILQMDSCLFQQEIIDTGIACNFIGAFIDFIKRDNRMNEEGLDFDTLLDSLGVEKSFPTIVTKTVFDWIAQYSEAKLFDVLELINDLYNSADICFSEFPNIPDGETHYIFREMQFERDINGINLLLFITDKKSGEDKSIIYPHLVAIEENSIRSDRHAKYYLKCENPSQKQRYREISSFIKFREPTEEESELIASGYLDTYRLIIYFKVE